MRAPTAKRTNVRLWNRCGDVRQELLDDDETDAGLNGALDGRHAGRDDDDDEGQRELVVELIRVDDRLLQGEQAAADAGDRAGEGEDEHTLPADVDADAGRADLATADRRQVAPGRATPDEQDADRAGREDEDGEDEERVAGRVEEVDRTEPAPMER